MTIDWQHAKPPAEPHPVEPRHDSTGHWVCHECRAPVNDGGRTIDMSLKDLPRGKLMPSEHGLQADGS